MISRTTLETMKVICNKKDECMNDNCPHAIPHKLNKERFCENPHCMTIHKRVECIQADPIKFELIS